MSRTRASADPTAFPAGTVTFLLTDVEGSTELWADEAAAMSQAISRHDELIDAAVAANRGVRPLEQGEGDSTVSAFARASDAVNAALEAQRQLTAEAWPTTRPLRVRMALHTGEAHPNDGRYDGSAIIRTARLRALAHGGQVLISSATRDLAVDELGDDASLIDVGFHRLKDLSRPEHVWQLAHEELPRDFAPLRSLDAVPNNLPVALTSFIGRFDAIDAVVKLVFDNRLVTLAGPGGAGKTRLAQQVAAEVTEAFPDGVWWVDLVAVTDPELVPTAVSRAALLPNERFDPIAGMARRLGSKKALFVLDNCEHVLDTCAELTARLLESCPQLSILTTSRSSLNVAGEFSWRVPGLKRDDAVRLFTDRAKRARSTFQVDEGNSDTVTALCERLDGIPLAIELAAARCRVLTPAEIFDGLSDAMGLLATTTRGLAERQQTIDASIRWSYALLGDAEEVLLRRLAIFAGSFTVEAAVGVAADAQLAGGSVLDALDSLVDQSLVQMESDGDVARFRMLETVRQFASKELDRSGESESLADRHAAYFADRARSLWPLFEPHMVELLDRADDEVEDLMAMLRRLETHAPPEEHAEVAMACLPALAVRHPSEAATLADRTIARVDDMSLLGGQLSVAFAVVEPTMPTHIQRAVAVSELVDDPALHASAAFWSAWAATTVDPTAEMREAFEAARRRLTELGETHFLARIGSSPASIGSSAATARRRRASMWRLPRRYVVAVTSPCGGRRLFSRWPAATCTKRRQRWRIRRPAQRRSETRASRPSPG